MNRTILTRQIERLEGELAQVRVDLAVVATTLGTLIVTLEARAGSPLSRADMEQLIATLPPHR